MPSQTYRKTPAGEVEIAQRKMGISAKLRRLLIVIDGVKSVSMLGGILLGMELIPALVELEQLGLIQSNTHTQEVPRSEAIPHELVAAPAIIPQEIVIDAEKLKAIKALLIDSSHMMLGLLGRGLIEQIQAVENVNQLNTVIARWNMTIRESKKGLEHADIYLNAIKTLLK